jgi:hypothetical protein
MGVTIHYRGRLDDLGRISALCHELTDIARTMKWPCNSLDDDWSKAPDAKLTVGEKGAVIDGHLGLKGVSFRPHPGAEFLAIYFDSEGYLRSIMNMVELVEGQTAPDEAWVFMKTQFASPDTHVWVIGLLKYLKRKYISNLEVSDESGYWETGDREELERQMALINDKLNWMSTELSSEPVGDGRNLSAEEIASRIEELFREQEES